MQPPAVLGETFHAAVARRGDRRVDAVVAFHESITTLWSSEARPLLEGALSRYIYLDAFSFGKERIDVAPLGICSATFVIDQGLSVQAASVTSALRYFRSDLKPARSSSAKSSGCSQAAKCPPVETFVL